MSIDIDLDIHRVMTMISTTKPSLAYQCTNMKINNSFTAFIDYNEYNRTEQLYELKLHIKSFKLYSLEN